jgi:HK97 gp10 family phage protein
MTTIVIEGLDKVLGNLENVNKKLIEATKVCLQESAILVKEEVQESILGNRSELRSYKTGAFHDSVDIREESDSIYIFTDIEYAKYLEFGTSKIDARPHFGDSAARIEPEVVQKFVGIIDNSIK